MKNGVCKGCLKVMPCKECLVLPSCRQKDSVMCHLLSDWLIEKGDLIKKRENLIYLEECFPGVTFFVRYAIFKEHTVYFHRFRTKSQAKEKCNAVL